ncbi:hypothetical protein [Sphingomonas changbaiensis]|uniref:hypothetical protein n=1 Tax=Sphingomonas changbaiensis TaxID=529705 RepID=UPI00061D3660|nr:hypothetical protein [Sphingomonas changbaiensis]
MAQIFSALFFTFAAIGAAALVAGLLRGEWDRVIAILGGEELAGARALAAPRVRVRVRAWRAPAQRRAQPLRAAA